MPTATTGEFGYRLLGDEARESGHQACDRMVWQICRDNSWWSVFGKKHAKNGKRPGPPAHGDLARRDFTATGPNVLRLTDVTEHHTGLLRQYFPKGTDLSRWSASDLEAVALALHNRPRRVLDWRTPAEDFENEPRSAQQAGVATTG